MRLMTFPVARLVILTLAPPRTAAEGSVTVPTMLSVPTVDWANKGQTTSRESALPEIQQMSVRTCGKLVERLTFATYVWSDSVATCWR